jgi:phosphate transport system substrate-binding protein
MHYQTLDDNKALYGTLNIKGSKHIERLIKTWISNFEAYYPEVQSTMDFKTSTKGINALINANTNISVNSRKIYQKEIDIFKQKRGYFPTEIKISLNVLAVYVNRANKINSMSLAELDALFSNTLKRGHKNKIENWQDISGINTKIHIHLYDINSTIRSYFKKKIMLNGTFKSDNIINDEHTMVSELIDEVSLDVNAIGFGNISNKNYKVKALSISKRKYFPSYKPNSENIHSNKYPLTRFFYIYLDIAPDKPTPKLLYEFCKYILSKEGQKVVSEVGGLTLNSKQVGIELSKIRK